MNYTNALAKIRESAPSMSIDEAFRLIEFVSATVYHEARQKFETDVERDYSLIPEATLWAYRNLMAGELKTQQAICIKKLRDEFNLGLRQAKGIVDVLRMQTEED